ncbi:hypothetical protein L798_04277 [Zootermopsis nevadensis]|uniref:Uncharacterized protein n=1 Tax=Zootermopsis nevadensis TaxID=136037 RepID=A0A067QFF1_ZOONE|nr:hypothetical protein L798_04277 [Zootermopsis nevadensis]
MCLMGHCAKADDTWMNDWKEKHHLQSTLKHIPLDDTTEEGWNIHTNHVGLAG